MRSCRNSSGPGIVNLISSAMISRTGLNTTSSAALTTMSMTRLSTAAPPRSWLRRMPTSGRPSMALAATLVLMTSSRSGTI